MKHSFAFKSIADVPLTSCDRTGCSNGCLLISKFRDRTASKYDTTWGRRNFSSSSQCWRQFVFCYETQACDTNVAHWLHLLHPTCEPAVNGAEAINHRTFKYQHRKSLNWWRSTGTSSNCKYEWLYLLKASIFWRQVSVLKSVEFCSMFFIHRHV